MPLYQTEAIALRSYDLGEADKIAVFYSARFGKLRAVAPGAKRPRSRFGSSLEPLTHVGLSFYEKEGAELARITECEILSSPYAGNADLSLSLYCIYFSELVNEFTQERDANDNIFRLLVAALRGMEAKVRLDLLARYFEAWLLKLEGYLPGLDNCSRCSSPLGAESAYLLLDLSQSLCRRCAMGRTATVVSAEARGLLARIMRQHPSGLLTADGDKAMGELERLNQKLITYHLGKELKSYALIKQLLRDIARDSRLGS